MTYPTKARDNWHGKDKPQWMANDDLATIQEVSELCHSMIAIGQALSRTEVDITARKLHAMECYSEPCIGALGRVVRVVDWYRSQLLDAMIKGYTCGMLEDFHEELEMALEDVDALGKEDR